jgi:hypothetical protein
LIDYTKVNKFDINDGITIHKVLEEIIASDCEELLKIYNSKEFQTELAIRVYESILEEDNFEIRNIK